MKPKEYEQNEDKIYAQLNSIGIPTDYEMQQEIKNGEVIHVHSYTRSNGTQVSGYYRKR